MMKKTVSLTLVLVMMLSILAPGVSNAARTPEAKAEELFNKSLMYFEPFNLDEAELKAFVTKDVFSQILYDLFEEEIKKFDNLSLKLGDGSELKAIINNIATETNISILLKEFKAGKAIDSLPILGKYITEVEELFEEDWDKIVNDEFRESAKDIISEVNKVVDNTVKNQFDDIQTHWAKEEIQALVGLGIVNGYPDGTFRPNGQVTRAEFSKMIVSALKLDSQVYNGGFSDVVVGHWHANFVSTMVMNQLAEGYPDGTFKPNGNITRNEMATILSKVLKLEISAEEEMILLSSFKDMALIPNWAKASVAEAAKAELMKGDQMNNFNGSSTATRAEAAAVIFRLLNR